MHAAEILRAHASPMEMSIQLTQEIQYFVIFMTLMQRKRDSYLFFCLCFIRINTVMSAWTRTCTRGKKRQWAWPSVWMFQLALASELLTLRVTIVLIDCYCNQASADDEVIKYCPQPESAFTGSSIKSSPKYM